MIEGKNVAVILKLIEQMNIIHPMYLFAQKGKKGTKLS